MATCLVGIPFAPGEFPNSILFRKAQANSLQAKVKYIQTRDIFHKIKLPLEDPLWLWGEWVESLPEMDKEPQELELMGSLAAC